VATSIVSVCAKRRAYAATKGAVKMFTQGLARDTDLNPAAGDWAAPQLANTDLNR